MCIRDRASSAGLTSYTSVWEPCAQTAPSAARQADSHAATPGGRLATLTPVARHAASRMTGYSSSST
eukprot:2269088-Alexandrium_andersonii.AAC.1